MSVFTADTSTQGTGGFPTYTKNYSSMTYPLTLYYSKSGIYNPSDNVIKIFTNNIDALTIDANQKVICNGSLITNLDWNNITANKPAFASVATTGAYSSLSGTPNLSIYATTTQLAGKQDTLTASTSLVGNGSAITNLTYANITGTPNLSGYATTTQLAGKQDTLTASTSLVGIGSAITNLTYANITGTPNLSGYATTTQLAGKQDTLTASTSLVGIGSAITNLTYANITGTPNLSGYATTTQLAGKQDTLTASTSLVGIGSAITNLTYANITGTPNLSGYATTTQLAGKQDTLTASTSLVGIGSAITNLTYTNITGRPDLSGYATTTQLAGKQDTLTALTSLVGIGSSITNLTYTNITGRPDLSGYATTTNLTTTSNDCYLASFKSSSNYTYNTSNFLVNYNNLTNRPDLTQYATTTLLNTKENVLTFNAPLTRTTNTIGLSYDSSLSLNGTQLKVANPNQWVSATNSSGGSILHYSQGVSGIFPAGTGFVGVGSAIPQQRLDVWGYINSSLGYTLSASSTTSSGFTWNNYGVSAIAVSGSVGSYSTSAGVGDMIIRSDNSRQLILQNGNGASGLTIYGNNVGIGCSPVYKLDVSGDINLTGNFRVNGTIVTLSSQWTTNGTNIYYTTGNVGIGLINPTTYKLDVNGSVNSTSYYRSGVILQNYLFNNNGNNHGNLTDFDSATEYGYNYIMGYAFGPGVNGAGQYYSWTIGLGANYGYGSASGWYGAQFALPRNVANPYLCVRYIENGVRGGWNRISAGYADSAGSASTATSAGTLSGNPNIAGNVGIGLNPSYPLHVKDGTTTTYNFSLSSYFGVYGSVAYGMNTTGATSFTQISAYFAGVLLAGRWIASVCDERIKCNIEDINDDTALQQILSIQPKRYNYIDNIKRGNDKVIGFSAQQVKEVIPEAVKFNKDFIPNIYKVYDINSNLISTTEDLTAQLNVDDSIRIINNVDCKEDVYKILEISSNVIKIDKSIEGDKCFIYGKEINDFHTLSKEYIFTLNVCATQELSRRIDNLNLIIQQQQTLINNLQSELNAIKTKIN